MVVTLSNGCYIQSNQQVHTDSARVNKEGKFVYIKYHFLAEHGQKQFTEPESTRMSGENPDYSKQQLWELIEDGKEVVWKANVQIMQPEEADAEKLGFDPFDVTKVWPRGQFPVCVAGPNSNLSVPKCFRCTSSAVLYSTRIRRIITVM